MMHAPTQHIQKKRMTGDAILMTDTSPPTKKIIRLKWNTHDIESMIEDSATTLIINCWFS